MRTKPVEFQLQNFELPNDPGFGRITGAWTRVEPMR